MCVGGGLHVCSNMGVCVICDGTVAAIKVKVSSVFFEPHSDAKVDVSSALA